MANWVEKLVRMISHRASSRDVRLLSRNFHFSTDVVAWVQNSARTADDREAFARLLGLISANPTGEWSDPLLGPAFPPGTRCVSAPNVIVIYEWDPFRDAVRIVRCTP